MPIFCVIPIVLITLMGIRLMNLLVERYVPTGVACLFARKNARD